MATRRITVKIGGKEYPMTIKQNDEEKYLRDAKEINKLITAYKASYVAEPEDYLAMAAIQVAVGKVTLEMDRSLSNQLAELEALNREIDNYLNDVKL